MNSSRDGEEEREKEGRKEVKNKKEKGKEEKRIHSNIQGLPVAVDLAPQQHKHGV